MFRFSWLISSVLTWVLIVVSVVAPEPDPLGHQFQDLIHSSRRLQFQSCGIFAPALVTAQVNLLVEVFSDLKSCLSTGCVIDVQSLPIYARYEGICRDVGGAFHLYSIDIDCAGIDLEVKNFPLCYMSARQNSACVPEWGYNMAGWFIYINDGCTAVLNHTAVTDYYIAPPPAMRPAMRPMRPVMRLS
jgi:hypothetical protein